MERARRERHDCIDVKGHRRKGLYRGVAEARRIGRPLGTFLVEYPALSQIRWGQRETTQTRTSYRAPIAMMTTTTT